METATDVKQISLWVRVQDIHLIAFEHLTSRFYKIRFLLHIINCLLSSVNTSLSSVYYLRSKMSVDIDLAEEGCCCCCSTKSMKHNLLFSITCTYKTFFFFLQSYWCMESISKHLCQYAQTLNLKSDLANCKMHSLSYICILRNLLCPFQSFF